jgi:hypothetical protein
MDRVEQIIEEIGELRNETNHRAALRIYNLLAYNRKLFLERMDPENFNYLTKGFEEISNSSLTAYNSESFKREYSKIFESLLFHLNRIV